MTKKEKIPEKSLLGIWSFDKKAIEDMKSLTRDTKHSGIEQGGLLCMDFVTKKINLQKQCTGSSCRIELPKNCENNTHSAGFFHTHPRTKNHQLSISDMIYYDVHSDYLGCLGLPDAKRNNVVCHKNKSNNDSYWNSKHKEKSNLIEMYKIEAKYVKGQPVKGIRKMIKYRKYYQDKFLTTFNPEDYVSD